MRVLTEKPEGYVEPERNPRSDNRGRDNHRGGDRRNFDNNRRFDRRNNNSGERHKENNDKQEEIF